MRTVSRAIVLAALCLMALGAPAAQAAFDDPLYTYRPEFKPPDPLPFPPPTPTPPPTGSFEGPCGVAVDAQGNFYLSDYYHRVVDLFTPGHEYIAQLSEADPLDGPCGLGADGQGNLYVNDFHRNVARFGTDPLDISEPFGAGTVITGAPLDAEHPTGVAVDPATNEVYVDDRDHVSVFSPSGAELGQIGQGSLQDGYGIAYSKGRIYLPDAATDTIKVYEAKLGETDPISTIDGSKTPNGRFVSLRDSAIAVDDISGEVYLADTLAPQYAERAETVIYVFAAEGTYEGRLKYSLEGALPVGLAVDNSAQFSQGRVYVTSGNTDKAALYAYRPGSATANAVPLPAGPAGTGAGSGAGAGPAAPTALPGPSAAIAPAIALSAAASEANKPTHRHRKPKHRRRHLRGPQR